MFPDYTGSIPFILHIAYYFIPKAIYSELKTKVSMHWYKALPFLKEHSCETDFLNSRARWRDGGHLCVAGCSSQINRKPAVLSSLVTRWAKSCRIAHSHYSVHQAVQLISR